MKKFNLKKLKFGVNNTVVIAFAVVFVLLLNVLVNLAETKFPRLKIDLTENAVTKISNETKAVLKNVDEGDSEIELIYLKGMGDENPKVVDVLEQYDAYCDSITYKSVNYHKNPMLLSSYNIAEDADVEGSVLVATKDKSKVRVVARSDMELTYNNNTVFLLENLLTNAVGVVASKDQMSVCFVTGHNETIGEMLVNLLKSENVNVTQFDLSTGAVPIDIDLLMIMAPQVDYTMAEINTIDNYLLQGGNVSVALPFGIVLERLEEYISTWGVEANNDIVLEQDSAGSYQQSGMYFFPKTTEYEAVSTISNRILASYARSLKYTKIGDIEKSVLFTTSAEGYSAPIKDSMPDRENMVKGTFDLGYILEKPLNGSFETTAKLIVTSTPSVWGVTENMITEYDRHVYYSLAEASFGNSDFVMNMLSDIFGQTIQNIYVPIKSQQVSILTLSETQITVMKNVLCVAVPVIVLLMGIVVWLKRRNK